ncbi:methyltransferase domain-containing protein [Nonomuraea sp. KC401]|uniref:class I SAM-dependent methyltransferase n=1 Tax=unclassified Nonomuraea TaxID=2593643 RepID=UPI0010FE2DD9|nr:MULTISPECIES: methyltransferase domain-containing protein [unclassified Nonomuraea]NBE99732.1 methyltransferase domain-containing protein [Nonomuraea sp. K271]TLF71375.1 methyltransferase domain-containing protein [Nonomuraea sp. KC401]
MEAVYTHGHHESVLRSHRRRTAGNSAAYLLPHLKSHMKVLDVGSGPGTITADLATRVGHVTASEVSAEALALARAEVSARGLGNVGFAVADVHALGFDDGTFCVTHAHQVLQHVGDPVGALREMRRVTRPGGIVAARDSDYTAFAWHPRLPALDEWMRLYQKIARGNGGEPDAGRRLLSWARAAGFDDITATSSTWCFATPEDRAWWGGMWSERVLRSAMARQALATGAATEADLRRISEGWLAWAADGDGWLSILHGEILCRA